MKFIYERENLTKSIPLMALMAAINIIVAELAGLSIFVSLVLVLVLPLTSAIVELCCKDRYFPIYAIATFGLSLALTFWNIETTIFYVFPSIITGYIFGLLAKKKVAPVYAIFAATLAQTGIYFALIPFINFLLQIDIVETFKTALGLANNSNVNIVVPTFIFFISLIQVSLSQIIVKEELNKFGVDSKKDEAGNIASCILGLTFALFIPLFYFFSLEAGYLFLAMSLYFAVYHIAMSIYGKNYYDLIGYAIIIAINIVVFALVQSYLKEASQLLLLGISSALICLTSLVFSFLRKKKEKIQ